MFGSLNLELSDILEDPKLLLRVQANKCKECY